MSKEKRKYPGKKAFLKFHTRGLINRIKSFFRNLKFAYQRVKRGYSDADVWDIYSWMSTVLPSMLEQLAKTSQGVPNKIYEEANLQESIGEIPEGTGEEVASKRWEEILMRIAFLLTEATEEGCSKKNPYEDEYLGYVHTMRVEKDGRVTFQDDDETSELRELYFAEEEKMGAYREKCKNEALDMIKEYYYNLWD